ncbi:hypothetical protein KY284_036358 [Solanum tuberosum]|nr:hypothetical protein KY284_036358 [Solanum tuberosum]
METRSKTYSPKGKVTLESSMRTPTEESRMMRILDESLVEFRRRPSVINSRLTKVEDDIWAKERGFTLPSYVVRRTIPRKSMINHEQMENIFYSKCLIQSQVYVLIIDSGSCANVASKDVEDYLKLPTTKHAKPYTLQWLNEQELKVHEQVLIKFQIGKYHDVVLCDVIPMQASHVLLGRPWQHNHMSIHDGRHNTYTVMTMECKYVLKLMSPSQVLELYRKMDELRDKRKKEEGYVEAEAQGERERRKLKGKAKLLLDDHKEMREEDPREALVMGTFVGCPDIPTRVSFEGKEDLSCGRQAACECSSLVEGPCNVIKEPQVSGANHNVDPLNRSDSMSISFAEDPIVCFVHRDHVLEHTSKNDICPFEGELPCFDSSLVVDHPLLKYNVLFEDEGITPSDVPSGVKLESSVAFNNYTVYSNPLWCEAFPPKDGNLFLADESTLVGKECDEEESGVGFPITSSSCHTHENTLEEVDLRDTFLYYLFTYDEAHVVEWSMMLENESASRAKGEVLGPSAWISFPFDPDSELNCGTCVMMLGQDDKYHLDGFVDNFPYDGKLLRVYNLIEEPTLCMGKVHPCHGIELAIANANPHAMRILFLFTLPMVLRGMDSRTNPFQEGENDTIWISSKSSIHELERIDGSFSRMDVHGIEKCALEELPAEQHPVWMIAWSMEERQLPKLSLWASMSTWHIAQWLGQ